MSAPHLRRDPTTSAPGLDHICAGTRPHLRRDSVAAAQGLGRVSPVDPAARASASDSFAIRIGEVDGNELTRTTSAGLSTTPPHPRRDWAAPVGGGGSAENEDDDAPMLARDELAQPRRYQWLSGRGAKWDCSV